MGTAPAQLIIDRSLAASVQCNLCFREGSCVLEFDTPHPIGSTVKLGLDVELVVGFAHHLLVTLCGTRFGKLREES